MSARRKPLRNCTALDISFAAGFHQFRRERHAAQEQAEATIAVSIEHGFPFFLAIGLILRGRALAEQGQVEDGIAQIRQGIATWRVSGSEELDSRNFAFLAEAYGKAGQPGEGLAALAEALAIVNKNGERQYEAELYHLKGELTLQQFKIQSAKCKVANPQPLTPSPQHLAPTRRRKPKRAFRRPSRSLATSRRSPGNSAPPRVSPACGRVKASTTQHAIRYPPSTTGSRL
jgi:predicted ATPase